MARFFIFALVLVPWLNPFSPGPTPAVLPFVFSWFCVALGLLITSVTDARRDTIFHSATLAWLVAACLSALIGVLQYVGATAWPAHVHFAFDIDHIAFADADRGCDACRLAKAVSFMVT